MVTKEDKRVITSVGVSKRTWQRLNGRKERPGESLGQVIERLLDVTEKTREGAEAT